MTQIPMMTLMEEGAGRRRQRGVPLVRAVSTGEIPTVMSQVRTELTLLDLVESYLVVGHFLGATTIRNLVHLRLVNAAVEALEWTARSARSSLQLLLRVVLQIIVRLLLQQFLLVLKLGALFIHLSSLGLCLDSLVDRSQFTCRSGNEMMSLVKEMVVVLT